MNASMMKLVLKIMLGKNQDFGQGGFYQSLPILNLSGQRPTDYRIKEYGILDYLGGGETVLDIGCNVGFFDIMLADQVKSITGVEYEKRLIRVARFVSKQLKVGNVNFIFGDFNEWNVTDNNSFDIILSFAVHKWINMPSAEYCKSLYDKLNNGGLVFFESQNVKIDKEVYEEYIANFKNLGMTIIKNGTIKDDGRIEREYSVLKK